MPGFERFDGVDVAQCHCDIVEACEQTLLARRIDREVEARAVGGCDGLRRQIDGDPCSWITADEGAQSLDLRLVEHDGKKPVLQAVAVEDVAEARPDERALTAAPRSIHSR